MSCHRSGTFQNRAGVNRLIAIGIYRARPVRGRDTPGAGGNQRYAQVNGLPKTSPAGMALFRSRLSSEVAIPQHNTYQCRPSGPHSQWHGLVAISQLEAKQSDDRASFDDGATASAVDSHPRFGQR